VEHHRRLYGVGHPEYATTLFNLALVYTQLRMREEAVAGN
jgi:hypothetical protein